MRRSVVGLAVTVLLLIAAESALACSCAGPVSRQQLRAADGAVIARLLEVRPMDDGDEFESSGDPTDFVYRIRRAVKGGPRLRKGRRLVVRSVRGSATCGLPDSVGERYGLLLDRADGRWNSSACQATSPSRLRRLADGESAATRSACS